MQSSSIGSRHILRRINRELTMLKFVLEAWKKLIGTVSIEESKAIQREQIRKLPFDERRFLSSHYQH